MLLPYALKIKGVFDMNTNTLIRFDNRFYVNYMSFHKQETFLRYSLNCNVKMLYAFQIFRINLNWMSLASIA